FRIVDADLPRPECQGSCGKICQPRSFKHEFGWRQSGQASRNTSIMKQLLQSVRTGEVSIADVSLPQLLPGYILVSTAVSILSAGTERKLLEFSEKTLLQKAVARPDVVRKVIDKGRRESFRSALSG